jgi:hypothetical protein
VGEGPVLGLNGLPNLFLDLRGLGVPAPLGEPTGEARENAHYLQVLCYLRANPTWPGAEDALPKLSSELEERRNNGTLHLPEINELPSAPCPEYERTIIEGVGRSTR